MMSKVWDKILNDLECFYNTPISYPIEYPIGILQGPHDKVRTNA